MLIQKKLSSSYTVMPFQNGVVFQTLIVAASSGGGEIGF